MTTEVGSGCRLLRPGHAARRYGERPRPRANGAVGTTDFFDSCRTDLLGEAVAQPLGPKYPPKLDGYVPHGHEARHGQERPDQQPDDGGHTQTCRRSFLKPAANELHTQYHGSDALNDQEQGYGQAEHPHQQAKP